MHCTPNDPIAPISLAREHTLRFLSPLHCIAQGYNTAEAATFPRRFVQQRKLMLTCNWKSASLTPEMSKASLAVWTLQLPMQKTDFPPHVWSQAFPFQQFHVLFNSLFKVLFIFPSLYLFAIGLSPIFSFRWNLPPILSCIPKQLDSLKDVSHRAWHSSHRRDSHPLWRPVPRDLYPGCHRKRFSKLQLGLRKAARFQIWAVPASLAVTRGILVGFFSSAYWYA